MAGGVDLGQLRAFAGADGLRERAARVEAAAGRRVDRVRRIAGDRGRLGTVVGVGRRHRGQQRAGVGMRRLVPDVIDRAEFDDLAEIHHQHAVRNVADDVEVMADEQIGQAEFALQIDQQVQHLRLDRLVERRHRLVENDETRRQRQCARDVDALALAAGDLVRIAVGEVFGPQPDLAEQFAGQRARGVLGHAVHLGTERDRLLDGQARIERGVAVLEHHLHAAAQFAQRQFAANRAAVIDDVAGIALHQVHQEARGGRLAAAGLADDADGLALGDIERHVVHGTHGLALGEQPAAHREMLGQPVDTQQRLRGAADIRQGFEHVEGFDDFCHDISSGCPWRCACHR